MCTTYTCWMPWTRVYRWLCVLGTEPRSDAQVHVLLTTEPSIAWRRSPMTTLLPRTSQSPAPCLCYCYLLRLTAEVNSASPSHTSLTSSPDLYISYLYVVHHLLLQTSDSRWLHGMMWYVILGDFNSHTDNFPKPLASYMHELLLCWFSIGSPLLTIFSLLPSRPH